MSARDLVGQKFGRWIVLNRAGRHHVRNRVMWFCKCKCGVLKNVVGDSLRSGASQSCGCLQKQRTGEASRRHGLTQTRVYHSWINMRQRCSNPNHPDYHSYGGRGISVCTVWDESFNQFYLDMGAPPEGKTIDRVDNDGDYNKGNCRWATSKQQSENTRRNVLIECGGVMMPVNTAAKITGINRDVVYSRIRRGWDKSKVLAPSRGWAWNRKD